MARNPSQPLIIDVRRSLAILDHTNTPVNLGKTYQEDSPEQLLPGLAMDYYNVLPTIQGYKSAFQPRPLVNTDFNEEPIDVIEESMITKTQLDDIIVYQTATGIRIHLAMTAMGLWGWVAYPERVNSEEALLAKWTPLTNIAYTDGYKLWTNCTLDNVTYIYAQGEPHVWAITDLASARNLIEKGAKLVLESEDLYFGLVRMEPNFLNMEGQIGIFKASNRLGFWDSDNATAWSSAIDKMDFTPDATTFAGLTTFSDIVGRITAIHSHGTGFIIYATGSIVYCAEMPDSVEKFSGRAISRAMGVLYPTQVATASKDTRHFAWTSAGLALIENAVLDLIEVETSRFLMDNFALVALRIINDTHLCISTTGSFTEAQVNYSARIVVSGDGYPGWFHPVPEHPPQDYREFFEIIFKGADERFQDEWEELEEPVLEEEMPPISLPRPLIPLWSGAGFNGVIGGFGETIPPRDDLRWINHSTFQSDVAIPSARYPNLNYYFDFSYSTTPNFDTSSINWEFGTEFPELAGSDFENLLPEELAEKLQEVKVAIAESANRLNKLILADDEESWLDWEGVRGAPPMECLPNPVPPNGGERVDFNKTPSSRLNNVLMKTMTKMSSDGCTIQILGEVADVRLFATTGAVTDEPVVPCPFEGMGSTHYYRAPEVRRYSYGRSSEVIEGSEREVVLMEFWISAWAYRTGTSLFPYRIVKHRPRSAPCQPSQAPQEFPLEEENTTLEGLEPETYFRSEDFWDIPDPEINYWVDPGGLNYPNDPGYPNYQFNYPPHEPIWATFQKGVITPYYPVYTSCLILDTQLGKWGSYNTPHRFLYDLNPKNNPDTAQPAYYRELPYKEFPAGVVPHTINPNWVVPGDEYSWDDWQSYYKYYQSHPCMLTSASMYSRITYGKVGYRRSGYSKLTGVDVVSASGLTSTEATLHIMASDNNVSTPFGYFYDTWWMGTGTGKYVTVNMQGPSYSPIMMVGRWFYVTVAGEFDLTGLTLYGHPEGRLRYFYQDRVE